MGDGNWIEKCEREDFCFALPGNWHNPRKREKGEGNYKDAIFEILLLQLL